MRLFAFCILLLFCSCQGEDFNDVTPYQYSDLTGFWEQLHTSNFSTVEYGKKKLVSKAALLQHKTFGMQLRANGKGYTNQLWHIGCFTGVEPSIYDLEWDWEVDAEQSLFLHLTLEPKSEYPHHMTYLVHEIAGDRLVLEFVH